MALPDPRIPVIPSGWAGPRASRKPMLLLPAELFNRTFRRAPDGTVHVALLRRSPIVLVVALGVIAVFFGALVWMVLAQAGTTAATQGPVPYVIAVVFGLLGLFFLATFVNALTAIRSRGSWGNRECVALGPTGIFLRMQKADVDVPWNEVTAVRATHTNAGNAVRKARAHVPILRIETAHRHWDIATSVLDASPNLVYTVLHFYWTHPGARVELGTAAAQHRMDAHAAS